MTRSCCRASTLYRKIAPKRSRKPSTSSRAQRGDAGDRGQGVLGRVVCAELLARGRPVAALVRTSGSEPPGTVAVVDDSTDQPAAILSDDSGIVECMFEQTSAVVSRLRAASRAENQAAGQRLAVIGELDLLWLGRVGGRGTGGSATHD